MHISNIATRKQSFLQAISLATKKIWSDATALLIIAQTLYLFIGLIFLEFNTEWVDPITAVAAAVITELAFTNRRALIYRDTPFKIFFPKSAIAAGLGIGIFLRAINPWYFALAGFIAIASKYLIRLSGRHIFNPSNIAIVSLVLLFLTETTIEFTQWGRDPLVYAIIATISLLIAYRAGVITTVIAFLTSYVALLVLMVAYMPNVFSLHHYGLIGPSFILFASFMITDPKTSPSGFFPRIMHGVSVALVYFFLEASGVRYGLFLAAFSVAILNGISSLGKYVAPRLQIIMRVAPNAGTFAVALMLFLYAYQGVITLQPNPNFQPLSMSFIFFGVESDTLRACTRNPLFVPVGDVGFKRHSMVVGAAWGDINDDGLDDLFISDFGEYSRLYRNDGNGAFTDITQKSGLPLMYNSSAFFADYDNDGRPDLFTVYKATLASWQLIPTFHQFLRVYHNEGGDHFKEVTKDMGLSGFVLKQSGGTLSFADYDNDGYLDFVLSTPGQLMDITPPLNKALEKNILDPFFQKTQSLYLCDKKQIRAMLTDANAPAYHIDPQTTQRFLSQGGCIVFNQKLDMLSPHSPEVVQPDYSHITRAILLRPGSLHLFKNEGGKKFTEIAGFTKMIDTSIKKVAKLDTFSTFSGKYPFDVSLGTFFQPVSFDYNADGLADIFVSTDFGRNFLLKNDGGFRFSDATIEAQMGYSGTGMGTDVSDYNGDGLPDIISTNVFEDYLFVNNGNGTFKNTWQRMDIGRVGVGWGVSFLDYNLDGWDDLYVANGDLFGINTIAEPDLSRSLFRADNVYENAGGKALVDVTRDTICSDKSSSRSLAISDYDGDGDPDILLGNYINPRSGQNGAVLYKNTLEQGHYLKVRLRGTKSNSMGIGARVYVTSEARVQMKQVLLGQSFYSQNSATLIFGLGVNNNPVDVEVQWSSGRKTVLKDIAIDRTIVITEAR